MAYLQTNDLYFLRVIIFTNLVTFTTTFFILRTLYKHSTTSTAENENSEDRINKNFEALLSSLNASSEALISRLDTTSSQVNSRLDSIARQIHLSAPRKGAWESHIVTTRTPLANNSITFVHPDYTIGSVIEITNNYENLQGTIGVVTALDLSYVTILSDKVTHRRLHKNVRRLR